MFPDKPEKRRASDLFKAALDSVLLTHCRFQFSFLMLWTITFCSSRECLLCKSGALVSWFVLSNLSLNYRWMIDFEKTFRCSLYSSIHLLFFFHFGVAFFLSFPYSRKNLSEIIMLWFVQIDDITIGSLDDIPGGAVTSFFRSVRNTLDFDFEDENEGQFLNLTVLMFPTP